MLFRRSAPRVQAPRLGAGDVVQVCGHPVRLAVNPRARRISLRLDVVRREAVATAPSPRALPQAVAFAEARTDWIAAKLGALPQTVSLHPGALIEVAGHPCRLERAAMRVRPTLKPSTLDEPARLLASGEGPAFSRAVVRGLRTEALVRLTTRTEVHCSFIGHPTPAIALQDARSRWGSCQAATPGRAAVIRYNWRLVLAPPDVLDYVAAHECAHLIEGNHGPRFWALVQGLYGDPIVARAWLKRHGASLHAVGVTQELLEKVRPRPKIG